MLRWALTGLALGAALLAALFGAGLFDPLLYPDRLEQAQQRRVATMGIRGRMAERYGDELRFFLVGREIGAERWDFRGQLVQGAEAKPFYGVARRDCAASDAQSPECWELESLAIDGEEVIAVGSIASVGAEGASAEFSAIGPAEGSAGDAPLDADDLSTSDAPARAEAAAGDEPADAAPEREEAAASGDAAPAAPAPPATALDNGGETAPVTRSASRPPPEPTHLISGTEVNVRAGPGRDYEALTVIYRGQQLEMLEDQGEWARFRLIGGESDGLEAWIFTPLTRPAG